MRFDLDHSKLAVCVVPEARPLPLLRLLDQPALHRVAVHIAKFLDPLLFAPDVEIVVTALPELNLSTLLQLARGLLFQHLERNRQRRPARLADKQMNMLRHQNITSNHKAVPHTHGLKLTLEDAVCRRRARQRLTTITTERDKVKTAALLVTDELHHNWRILYPPMSEVHASPPFARKEAKDRAPSVVGWLRFQKLRVRHPPTGVVPSPEVVIS